jgi:hypothetical protein
VVEEPLLALPELATGLQQLERAVDVGPHELTGPEDAAIHVALGGEVNDQIWLMA